MANWNVYNKNCPTRLILDRIADKWTILLVGALTHKTRRFNELKRDLDGISQKVLAQTLKGLERDGIVHREVYPTIPPKVEYSLTPLGSTLIQLLEGIRNWSEGNIEKVIQSQEYYDSFQNDKTSDKN